MPIKTFRNRELEALWTGEGRSRIDVQMHARIERILNRLEAATTPEDMNLPGLRFHRLQGRPPLRYAVSVNGPWRVTFSFEDGDAFAVDYEQYH